jgi:hypothetical protein
MPRCLVKYYIANRVKKIKAAGGNIPAGRAHLYLVFQWIFFPLTRKLIKKFPRR